MSSLLAIFSRKRRNPPEFERDQASPDRTSRGEGSEEDHDAATGFATRVATVAYTNPQDDKMAGDKMKGDKIKSDKMSADRMSAKKKPKMEDRN